jgi:hypothetical protein
MTSALSVNGTKKRQMDNGQDNELFIGLLNNAFPTPQNIKRK